MSFYLMVLLEFVMVYCLMCVFKACRTEISLGLCYVSHLRGVRTEIMLLFARARLLYLLGLLLFGYVSHLRFSPSISHSNVNS
jgi:hypothetical protein